MTSSKVQLGYDAVAFKGENMTDKDVETILKFFMAKLPEDQLAELDGLLEGGAGNKPAMDAALGDKDRREWLGLSPLARNSLRRSKRARLGMDAETRTTFKERFPNADRLERERVY